MDPVHISHEGPHAPYQLSNRSSVQHETARKRSTLPSRSIKIMRAWFNQNIMDPYPSEEQKAWLSSATGISMIQISAWFINRRRRCPEFLEKRTRMRRDSTKRVT
ncbi:homeodomain superfamily [Elasticomyces elasticus]|nr:homeodomain superfamily [Elasticomyces elasticus]